MSEPPTLRSDSYMRRLELAMDRIHDATRRLSPRDRIWTLNACLREALDATPDQAARSVRESSPTSK
jgi:hypothetical protein